MQKLNRGNLSSGDFLGAFFPRGIFWRDFVSGGFYPPSNFLRGILSAGGFILRGIFSGHGQIDYKAIWLKSVKNPKSYTIFSKVTKTKN